MELQRKGPWTAEEDELLMNNIRDHGEGLWKSLPHRAGLQRCGKSCRLRWKNYLKPDIRRGNITPEEDDIIIRMHMLLGNRWSLIAGHLPGRTDNKVKNYWNSHLGKRLKFQGIFPLGAPPNLLFRHGRNDPYCNASDNMGETKNKNMVDADDHVYDDEHKHKRFRYDKNVKITERVKFFTPKPNRICTTTSSSRAEDLNPKPVRVAASYSWKTDMHASNMTSAIGNIANNISCNEDVEEKDHCNEICTDDLKIHDGCRRESRLI